MGETVGFMDGLEFWTVGFRVHIRCSGGGRQVFVSVALRVDWEVVLLISVY